MADQVSSIFIDQDESMTAVIGTNYLQNFMAGGAVEKSVGVLTQKRFYFKGQNFSGSGKETKKTTEEGVVSIEDITFTMFSHTRAIGMLLFAALLLLVSSIGFPMEQGYLFSVPCWIAAAVSVIMYFVNRRTVFSISFPGGSFGFDIRYYPIADIRDFQRQLHLLKDQRKENV